MTHGIIEIARCMYIGQYYVQYVFIKQLNRFMFFHLLFLMIYSSWVTLIEALLLDT